MFLKRLFLSSFTLFGVCLPPLARSQAIAEGAAPSASWAQWFDASRARPALYIDFTAYPARKIERPIAGTVRRARSKGSPLSVKAKAAEKRWPPLIVPTPRVVAAYRRTFQRLLSHPETTNRYDDIIRKYADRFGLDPRLLKAIISAESEFTPGALSPSGAVGLMQVMVPTAGELGVSGSDLWNPEINIRAGAAYLAKLFAVAWSRFRLQGVSYAQAPAWLLQRVLAAYHAGPRFLFHGGWHLQTRRYVSKVVLFYRSEVADLRRWSPSFIPPFSRGASAGY